MSTPSAFISIALPETTALQDIDNLMKKDTLLGMPQH